MRRVHSYRANIHQQLMLDIVEDKSYGVKHLDEFKKEMGQYYTQPEDVLSYALFPQVAEKFFQNRQAKQIGLDNSVLDKANNAMPL